MMVAMPVLEELNIADVSVGSMTVNGFDMIHLHI
jgi:hypothetical protein